MLLHVEWDQPDPESRLTEKCDPSNGKYGRCLCCARWQKEGVGRPGLLPKTYPFEKHVVIDPVLTGYFGHAGIGLCCHFNKRDLEVDGIEFTRFCMQEWISHK